MKLDNMKIATKLRLGLGLCLVLLLLMGTMAYWQNYRLWQETRGLYEHPLMVQRVAGELQINVLTMQRYLRDLLWLAPIGAEQETLLQRIDVMDARAHEQIDALRAAYLGPLSDIDTVHDDLVRWRTLRDESIRLLRAGTFEPSRTQVTRMGSADTSVDTLLDHVQMITDFARARGDLFMRDAQREKQVLGLQMTTLTVTALVSVLAAVYGLLRAIRTPLRILNTAADDYREGRLEARSSYVSNDEFGSLSDSFNRLVETVQFQTANRTNVARLADVMIHGEDLLLFCQALLKDLLPLTDSQMGGLYILNEAGTEFVHIASIGLTGGGRRAFPATTREGEFGPALATRTIQHIRDIPADTCWVLSTVTGDLHPREILTVPIEARGGVVAMLSLASVRSYSPAALLLVQNVWPTLAARLNNLLSVQQVRDFSEKLEIKNRELEEQTRELAAQTDELGEQNIELEVQRNLLGEASRLKSAFLSNMSHELRTPLNSVIALSGVLSRRLQGKIPAEEYSYLDVIERNGRNLLTLINAVLDLSRIEAGREELSISRFAPRDWVNEVVGMLSPQAREKGIDLVSHVSADLPELESDVIKCRHILQNIVGNAVKFTEQGGIDITAQVGDGRLQVMVKDTGIGIALDQQVRIFEEFRQADESTARRYGGTGLGLAIARKYAALLGADIGVQSVLGQGSVFTINLPLKRAPGVNVVDAYRPPVDDASPFMPAGKTILIVEDSEAAIVQLRDILLEQQCRVLVARNGREALVEISKAIPDAMILDLMMPEVDGFAVLKSIRETDASAQLPVLILTSKHVTREELSFLKHNHIYQLIQKGDVNRAALLVTVGKMVAPRAESRRRTMRPPRTGRPIIQVVDNNPDNLQTTRALLKDVGMLLEATDGAMALEQLRDHKPDLILLDVSLSSMDGFNTLEAIRREDAGRDIPVVALTARAMKGDREQILARGFDAYVSKPIDQDILENVIREFLHV